jgi:hypothetical protein
MLGRQLTTSYQTINSSHLVKGCVSTVDGKRDAGLLGGRVELETGHPGGQGLGGLSWLHGELQGTQVNSASQSYVASC